MQTPRSELAQILKDSRLDAGFRTQAMLARELHIDRTVVTRAESEAQALPSDDVVKAWAKATSTDLEPLMELVGRCKSSAPEWFMPYLGAESTASVLRLWGPRVVPGPIHTENYARTLLALQGFARAQIDELLKTRHERQAVIGRARIIAAIDTAVLERRIGSPKIMSEQCGHLVTLTEAEKIRLHVVPEGANVGLGGAFAIASRGSLVTVSLTTMVRDITTTAADVVDDTVNAFEMILGASMTTDASLDFLRNKEDQWNQQL